MNISERLHIHNSKEHGKNRKIRIISYSEERQIEERNRARVEDFIKLHPDSELPKPTPRHEKPLIPGVAVKIKNI